MRDGTLRGMRERTRGGNRSRRRRGGWAAAALAAGLLLPASAQAAWTDTLLDALAVPWDLLVVRPLGLGQTAVGAVLFVPAAVLSSPGGRDSIDGAWEHFVETPGRYTFTRPLGEL